MYKSIFNIISNLTENECRKLVTSNLNIFNAVSVFEDKNELNSRTFYGGMNSTPEQNYDFKSQNKLTPKEFIESYLYGNIDSNWSIPSKFGISVYDVQQALSDDPILEFNVGNLTNKSVAENMYPVILFEFKPHNVILSYYINETLCEISQNSSNYVSTMDTIENKKNLSSLYNHIISYKDFLNIIVTSHMNREKNYVENTEQTNKNSKDHNRKLLNTLKKVEKNFLWKQHLNLVGENYEKSIIFPQNFVGMSSNNHDSIDIVLSFGEKDSPNFYIKSEVPNKYESGTTREKTVMRGSGYFEIVVKVSYNEIVEIKFHKVSTKFSILTKNLHQEKVSADVDSSVTMYNAFEKYLNDNYKKKSAFKHLITSNFTMEIQKNIFSDFYTEYKTK